MKRFKYYILSIAVAEFREARKWYASKALRGLSNRFAKAVKDSLKKFLFFQWLLLLDMKTHE
jgi:hypothetical protein